MEVKNIFVNLIMRNYDNHGVSRPMHAHAEPPEGDPARASHPCASPYDAYIHTMNILKDFSVRIGGESGVRP